MTDPVLYSGIRISGDDAGDFLQGQLTQDVNRLGDAITLPAAWCNPKGRVFTTARLIRGNESIDLVLPAAMVAVVLPRLSMYRLRAKVDMQPLDSAWAACAVADTDNLAALAKFDLQPAQKLNVSCAAHGLVSVSLGHNGVVEIYGERNNFAQIGLNLSTALSTPAWQAARIDAGLVDIGQQNSEKYTPHMLNLDATGAISFDKGCYTGQEVVARTENLGKSKRRLMRYGNPATAASIGDPVSDGARDVGSVVNIGDKYLLAVTPAALHGDPMTLNGERIEPSGLPYAV